MTQAPEVNEDFVDMLSALKENDVAFLIVGAYSLAAHGLQRATGDIDILVQTSRENALKVHQSEGALPGRVGPCEVLFMGKAALIKDKRAAGRAKDIADVEQLLAAESCGSDTGLRR